MEKEKLVLGIDECGTGAWAGSFYICGVLATESWTFQGLNDSKKLTKNKRESVAKALKETDLSYYLYRCDNSNIDKIGLAQCLKNGYNEIINNFLQFSPKIIIDGDNTKDIIGDPIFLPKADGLVSQVMAASILAKVTRDNEMKELSKIYTNYGFESHVGYGTKLHKEMLEKFGPCDIHRKSYKPIKQLLENNGIKNITGWYKRS